jgi:hypothetical protein
MVVSQPLSSAWQSRSVMTSRCRYALTAQCAKGDARVRMAPTGRQGAARARTRDRMEFSFLMRCASSMMM